MLGDYQITSPVQIRADVITELPPIVGAIPALVYLHVVASARYSEASSILPTGARLEQGEVIRTVRQIAEHLDIGRSQVDRAIQKLIALKLLEERPLGDSRILRVTSYLSVITLSQNKAIFGTLAGQERDTSGTDAGQERDTSETLAGQGRDKTETINNISIRSNSSTLKSTTTVVANAPTDHPDTSPKRSKRTKAAKPVLPRPEDYTDIQIPMWRTEVVNPLRVPVLPFTPPNQVPVGETLLPLVINDVNPYEPGTTMPAIEVYKAVFWVRPKEWYAFTLTPDFGHVDDFFSIEAWAISNREKFHTDKRYSDHTSWLMNCLRKTHLEKTQRGQTNGYQRYGAS